MTSGDAVDAAARTRRSLLTRKASTAPGEPPCEQRMLDGGLCGAKALARCAFCEAIACAEHVPLHPVTKVL